MGEWRPRHTVLACAVIGAFLALAALVLGPGWGWSTTRIGSMAALGLLVGIVPMAVRRTGPRTGAPPSPLETEVDAGARWVRVQALFQEALEVPAEAREPLLARAADSDADVVAEVRSLLAAHVEEGPLDQLGRRLRSPAGGPAGGVRLGATAAEHLEGATVLHYEVGEHLGSGGMGVVYKARDARLGRNVVLKFLSGHLLANAEAKDRFLVEARSAAALDHPNICTIHEIGETESGLPFIAMTYYAGETLNRRIRRGALAAVEAVDIATQICRGLAAAHARDIVHRDVKPANVLLTEDGGVKVLDFGLAKRIGGSLTRTGARLGTPAYMSPEQTRGDPVDQRTDVWSVGVILYEMLAGARPFQGGSDWSMARAVLELEPTPIRDRVPGLGTGVAQVVERALRKEPERRFPDAASLLAELERLELDPDSAPPAAPTSAALPAEGERRLVTVLAFSLSGVEALLDTLPPDLLEQRLAGLRARVQGTVEDYGGVLNEVSDDRLVALFGVPLTHEDDPLRAVRAALELRDAQDASDVVRLRAALSSGRVVIRATDDPRHPYRLGGTLTREVSQLAARAEPDEVIIAGDLARSVRPFVDTEDRPGLDPGGGPWTAPPSAVVGERSVHSRLDAALPGTLTRFVGRKEELRTLMNALEATNLGGGRMVSIVGDAGVGKSRLLHEFRSVLADESIRYVQGRCQYHGHLTPFVPFIECVRTILGLGRVAPEQIEEQVAQRTVAMASELEIFVPLFLHLLSVESADHPVPEYLVGEDLRVAIGEALVSLFTLGARGQPLVLLLEDWHWADTGSHDVLNQLAEMIAAYPVLVVVTSRPPADGYRDAPRGQVHLDHAPLEHDSAVQIMRGSLGARLPDSLATRIDEKTGGNPFFIEELCRTLLEDGTLVAEGGVVRAVGDLERLGIPDTVQAVLRARLDRLDPEAREVLRSASVIGREFGSRLLSRVVPSAARLGKALETLRSAGLIQRVTLVPEPIHRFKHALTLDVTYDSLLQRHRKEGHRVVGEAMEEVYESRIDEFSHALARHFAGAEEWDRAILYGFAAARRAEALWRLDEAVSTLQRTCEWIERRGGRPEERNRSLVEALLKMERHLETLGRREDQQRAIDEILRRLPPGPSPARSQALVRQGELHTITGDQAAADRALREALTVAEECGGEEERILAVRAIGHRYWRFGRYEEAVGPLTEVVEHDRRGEPGPLLLRDLVNLGRVCWELGRWDEAEMIGHEVRSLGAENPADEVYTTYYLGHLYRTMKRLDEALAEFERGAEVGRRAHLPVRLTFMLLGEAAVLMDLGRIDESVDTYREAVDTARRTPRSDTLAVGLSLFGEALVTLGRSTEAIPLLEEAVALQETIGDLSAMAGAATHLARARTHLGRADAADSWARVRTLKKSMGDRDGVLQALEQEARLRSGDPGLRESLLGAALELALELGNGAAEARLRNALAIAAWRSGDLEQARRQYERAADLLRSSADRTGLGAVLNGLGVVLTGLERSHDAVPVLEEALAVHRVESERAGEADALSALGAAERSRGDLPRARMHYEACVERRREIGDATGEGWALFRLASVSSEEGDRDRAAEYLVHARAVAERLENAALARACDRIRS